MVDITPESQHQKNSIQLDSLQQEVIGLLDEIGILIDNTQQDLNNHASESEVKYDQFQQQITAAGKNVADLQLRMAIVAPMKAGKSTIINAIAGQELLPNCAVAMTTIPTEIVFNTELNEPILYLTQEILTLFQNIDRDIKQQIQQSGIESLQQKLNRYPHLLDLLTEVANSTDLPFDEQVVGRKAIATALNRLNHTVRLYSVIEPFKDPLAQLKDVPRIQTPFLGMGNSKQAKTLGNLTIIDTPGPNEAGENLKLTAVVEEQLRRSSMVLVVLDFTQLNNEAAEAIKRQIKPIVESIGTTNLYILVNKVDQRRQGDMTSEQVKDFVVADLGLSQDNDRDRIFEVAAIRAFAATKFLLELQQRPGVKLLEINSLASLAPEVLGIDWDEELDDITVDILAIKAQKLWHKSGFAPFIDSAIAALMANAAPKCLAAALNLSRNHLLELRDDLNLRSHAISQDTAKLQAEVTALETDLNHLESCRDRLSGIAEIKIKLQQNLQTLLEQLKTEAAIDVENFFAGEEYQQGDLLKKADIQARNLLLSNLGDFELFPKWVSENLKAGLEYKTAGIVSFKTELEAEYFTQETITRAKERLETLLLKVRQDIEAEIKQASLNLENFLIQETQAIIERAKNRLQTAFEIELYLPSPTIQAEEELEIEQQLVKTKTRLVDDGYEELLVKKRAWYYWLGVVPFYSQEKHQKPYKKEDYYTVSVHEVVNQINVSSEAFVNTIQQNISIYLEQELHQQVDKFFVGLDNYLGSYLKNLQQAQLDHKLSLEQREKLSNNLVTLVPQATHYINKADNYLKQTEQILVSQN
jgi:GTPase SAR1 family protein